MPVVNTGTESNGISAHGTIIKRNGANIAELKDITPPALTRKPIDTTTHNSDDDSYVVGIRRKGELQFMINFLPSGEASHSAVNSSGLLTAWATGTKDRIRDRFPGRRGVVILGLRDEHRCQAAGRRRAGSVRQHPSVGRHEHAAVSSEQRADRTAR
jgi:hypothetical protein